MTLTVKVSPGKHTIKIAKTGYFPIKFDVDVKAGETKNISKTLIETSIIKISSITHSPNSPKVGDTITLYVTVENISYNVSPTPKVVVEYDSETVEKEGYSMPKRTGDIPPMETLELDISFDSAGTKTITIKAFVYVEEHENGAGWYLTDTKTYTITVGETTATLNITTVPSGAAVYIDGVYKGTT